MLVLSLFPGIGLLDRAFELEGFCVVRGPDLLWGGDIRTFHPPAGKFDGVIGGPPCQMFSRMRHLNPRAGEKHGNMIPEFERCVREAEPSWFVMENVLAAPIPDVPNYMVLESIILRDVWVGGSTVRLRRFSFGSRFAPLSDGTHRLLRLPVEYLALWSTQPDASPLAGHGPVGRGKGHSRQISLAEAARRQGLPEDFLADSPLTVHGRRAAIGNGVPLPMGRAIAKAVKMAIAEETT